MSACVCMCLSVSLRPWVAWHVLMRGPHNAARPVHPQATWESCNVWHGCWQRACRPVCVLSQNHKEPMQWGCQQVAQAPRQAPTVVFIELQPSPRKQLPCQAASKAHILHSLHEHMCIAIHISSRIRADVNVMCWRWAAVMQRSKCRTRPEAAAIQCTCAPCASPGTPAAGCPCSLLACSTHTLPLRSCREREQKLPSVSVIDAHHCNERSGLRTQDHHVQQSRGAQAVTSCKPSGEHLYFSMALRQPAQAMIGSSMMGHDA